MSGSRFGQRECGFSRFGYCGRGGAGCVRPGAVRADDPAEPPAYFAQPSLRQSTFPPGVE